MSVSDATNCIRVYAVIDGGTFFSLYSEDEWNAVLAWFLTESSLALIEQIAVCSHNHIALSKRNQGTGVAARYTFITFEIDADQRTQFVNYVNNRAAQLSITGNLSQKAIGILQSEIRDAAVKAGYSAPQAVKLKVTLVNTPGVFDRAAAIAAAQAYLAANDALWHAAGV